MQIFDFIHRKLSPRVTVLLQIFAYTCGIAAIFWVCTYKIMDRDFWWHIKAGEIFWTTHQWITLDPFAYAREGLPYLATHEWLAQIILFLIYKTGGSTGIILFRGVIASASIGLLLLLAKKQHIAYVLLAVWAVVMTKGSYLERPQLFTFLFFAAFLLLAFRWLDAENMRVRKWLCAAFVVLELLWVNMHGGAALVGYAIVGCLLLQSLYSLYFAKDGRENTNTIVLLALTLIAMAVTLILPPNGFGTITYLSQLLNDQTIAFIAEWQPRAWSLYLFELWPFYALALFALYVGKRHWLFNGLLLCITAYLSRQAIRHEILFIYTAIATVFYQFDRSNVKEKVEEWIGKYQILVVGASLLGIALLSHVAYQRSFFFEQHDNLFGFGQFDLAKGAYDFIEREKITGNMFNTYGIGGYLINRGYPDRKVFIDGRNVDYGFDYMAHAYAAGVDADRWGELAHTYNFSYAIVDYDAIPLKDNTLPYSKILEKDPEWAMVYLDDWVAVYLKKNSVNQPLIDRYGYTQVTATALHFKNDFADVPAPDLPKIIAELQRVKTDNPLGIKATLALSKIFLRQKQFDDVDVLLEEAIKVRPYNPEAYGILAALALEKEDWKKAADSYLQLLHYAGNNYPNINYTFIAAVFEKAGYTWSAWRYGGGSPGLSSQKNISTHSGATKPSLAVNPAQDAMEFNEKGILEAQSGTFDMAEESFRAAIKMNPSNPASWSNLCALYVQMKKNSDAQEACKQAINLDPKSADAHFNLALVYYQSGSYKNAESEALLAKKFGRGTEADNLLLLLRKKKS